MMKANVVTVAFAIAWFLLPLGAPADHIKIENRQFDHEFRRHGITLQISGAGLQRFLGIFKVYVGALYLPGDVTADQVLEDIPKRLEVEYLRAVRAEDISWVADRTMAENMDARTMERLRQRLDQYNTAYQDMQAGDRASMTYFPGKGTELTVNGQVKGIIEGADFAEALFALWLGPRPFDRALKQQLLGLRYGAAAR